VWMIMCVDVGVWMIMCVDVGVWMLCVDGNVCG
jgi:hypothetical protein